MDHLVLSAATLNSYSCHGGRRPTGALCPLPSLAVNPKLPAMLSEGWQSWDRGTVRSGLAGGGEQRWMPKDLREAGCATRTGTGSQGLTGLPWLCVHTWGIWYVNRLVCFESTPEEQVG